MSEVMYICQKAKECEEDCIGNIGNHNVPHKHNEECDFDDCLEFGNCGVCIPYVVPDTCPECKGYGQIRHEDLIGEGQRTFYVKCAVCNGIGKIPADLKPTCPEQMPLTPHYETGELSYDVGFTAGRNLQYEESLKWHNERVQQMPLIEMPPRTGDTTYGAGVLYGMAIQRDADMAWHKTREKAMVEALWVIELLASDYITESCEMDVALNRVISQENAVALSHKIGQIYRAAHSILPEHTCYEVHELWRKETAAAYAALKGVAECNRQE